MRRRDLLVAGLGFAGAGAAEALRPRRKLVLLQGATLAQILPTRVGSWSAVDATGLVSPEQAGKLVTALYSEIVGRQYTDEVTGATVMLLAAYGDTQSDLLQLHRPESCYPAVGFAIQSTSPVLIPLSGGAKLPARKVVAVAGERVENIVYWARLGDALPQSGGAQRDARLKNAMRGYVGDGILVRCSMIGDSGAAFETLDTFVPQLLHAVAAAQRPPLIGRPLAAKMV